MPEARRPWRSASGSGDSVPSDFSYTPCSVMSMSKGGLVPRLRRNSVRLAARDRTDAASAKPEVSDNLDDRWSERSLLLCSEPKPALTGKRPHEYKPDSGVGKCSRYRDFRLPGGSRITRPRAGPRGCSARPFGGSSGLGTLSGQTDARVRDGKPYGHPRSGCTGIFSRNFTDIQSRTARPAARPCRALSGRSARTNLDGRDLSSRGRQS